MIPLTEAPPAPFALPPSYPRSLLAGSREGLAGVSAALADAVGTVREARRPTGPVPAGRPRDVLAAAAGTLGPARLPAEGLGAEAALRLLATVLVEHGIDLAHPAPRPTCSRPRWRSPSPRTPWRARPTPPWTRTIPARRPSPSSAGSSAY